MARSHFRIGDLLVKPDQLVVVRNGQEFKLEPRMMDVLVMLAERARDTVTETARKEELLATLWKGDNVYDDNPLSKTVSNLRKRIGDNSRKPRYIETVSKVGYRVIETVVFEENYRRTPSEVWTQGNPYVGLSAFDAKHADVYCGRTRIVGDLLRAMRNQIENQRRFVLISGASGCGKTSLLRAGAIPLLMKPDGFDGLRALSIAECDLAAASTGDPLTPLASALASWTIGDSRVLPPQTLEQLKKLLAESSDTIQGFIAEAFQPHRVDSLANEPCAHLLLVIDHAEALVATPDTDPSVRETFARIVQKLCTCPHVLVVMIVRGDFYQKLMEALPALADYKGGEGHLDVFTPREGEIYDIIHLPAWKAGLDFEKHPETNTLLGLALRDAALSQPDVLPLLQHTLQSLYEGRNGQQQLTYAAYNKIGGLEGAIAHRAEEVFAALPEGAQKSLDEVLARLIVIHPDNDAISARRAETEIFDRDSRALIDAFIEARLFVSDRHNGDRIFGVVHEALLRRWPRAAEWALDNRRLLQAKARLERAAARWAEAGKQDDHLLNPGRPLGEALEIASSPRYPLTEAEHDFVDASMRIFNRKRRLRRGAIAALVLLTLTAITMASLTQVARSRADVRRAETQDILNYTTRELVEKIEPTGNIEQLESIAKKTISHYRKQHAAEMRPSDLVNYSRALRILGMVRSAQGRYQEAATLYGLSSKKAGTAIDMDNKSNDAWFELSQAIYYLGLLEFDDKKYEAADKKWKPYLLIARKFTAKLPNDSIWLREESYALNNLGSSALRQGKADSALVYFKKSVVLKQTIARLSPKDLDKKYDLIDTRSWLASALEAKGNRIEASQGYDEVIKDLRSLLEQKKNANTWRLRLANYLMLSANIETSLGNHDKAIAAAKGSVGILTRLNQLEPDNSDWAKNLDRALKALIETESRKSSEATPKGT